MTDRIADLKEVDYPGHPLHGQTIEVEPRNVTARWVTVRGPDGVRYSLSLDWLRDAKPEPTVAMADPYFREPDYNAALRRSVKVIASGSARQNEDASAYIAKLEDGLAVARSYIAEIEAKVARLSDELARQGGGISAEDREWAMREVWTETNSRYISFHQDIGRWHAWDMGHSEFFPTAEEAIRQLIAWRDEDRAKDQQP